MANTDSGWLDFWNRPHAIYANQRNLDVHFDALRRDLTPLLPADGIVLDFGCGDALAAEAMAERCRTVYLYDAAPAVQARLRERFAGHPRIHVLDDEGYGALPQGGIDLLVVVSVVQYIPQDAIAAQLERWGGLLAPGGRLLVADVVEPDTPMLRDVASQLALARRNGFLTAALTGLVRLALSDYRQIRDKAGFSAYTPGDMLRLLADAGLEASCLPRNVGPTPHRHSFVGRRPAVAGQRVAEAAKVQ